jgi:septal ring factor EnvC (AmiA/AmiB activator)
MRKSASFSLSRSPNAKNGVGFCQGTLLVHRANLSHVNGQTESVQSPKLEKESDAQAATISADPATSADPSAAPPPAAKVVVEAQRTERELQLEDEVRRLRSELETTRTQISKTEAERKAREFEIMELQDRLHQLKKIVENDRRKPILPTILDED